MKNGKVVTQFLNAILQSLNHVVPVEYTYDAPSLIDKNLTMNYGVLIGMTGEVKGQVILSGDPSTFAAIGEKMFGMSIEGEMLTSFTGELGNMITGGMATTIGNEEISIDITSPTILQGSMKLSGHRHGLEIPGEFKDIGKMSVFLLLD